MDNLQALKDNPLVRLLEKGVSTKQPLGALTHVEAQLNQAAFIIGWTRYVFVGGEPLEGMKKFFPDAYETTDAGTALLAAIYDAERYLVLRTCTIMVSTGGRAPDFEMEHLSGRKIENCADALLAAAREAAPPGTEEPT